jgi:hypothetical protein
MRKLRWLLVAAAVVGVPGAGPVLAQPAAVATANSEDARLTAFLDQEFDAQLKFRPPVLSLHSRRRLLRRIPKMRG